MKKSLKLFALLFSSSLVLAGCDEFEPNWPMEAPNIEDLVIDTPWTDYAVPVTSIALGKGESNLELKKGDTYTFSYTAEPRDAFLSNLVWESSDPSVATIENGVLTALAGGQTNISVSCGEVSAKSKVNVVVPIEDFEVKNKALDLDIEGEAQIEVDFSPIDTTQNKIKYELVEPGKVTVSDSGLVKALKNEGDAEIRVTNEVLNKVETVTVHVSDKWNYISEFTLSGPTSIEVSKSGQVEASIVGTDPSLPATTLRENAITYSVKEGSENKISVNAETGEFTALDVGNATIVASIFDGRATEDKDPKTAEFTVNIFEVSATGISLGSDSHTTIELNNKDADKATYQLSYSYVIEDAYKDDYDVPSRGKPAFSSDDKDVATVSEDGLITFVGASKNPDAADPFETKIRITDPSYTYYDSLLDKNLPISDYVTVHNTVYAESISIVGDDTFYLDETITLTAETNPKKVSENLVWEYDDSTGHTFVEDGNQLKITCNNLNQESIEVTAKIGATLSDSVTLTPSERDVAFENGKVYIVGSSNYKGGTSKDTADGKGSWSAGKYAFVMSDKTGNTNALYEYKATIEFRENDLWKIRENATDWRGVEGWAGPEDGKYQTGRYKLDEGAFAKGQMVVTSDDDQNIKVVEAGKYDVYYAVYSNEHPEGWYEVYVIEHGMRLSSLDVHAKLTDPKTVSTIEVFEREGDIALTEVDTDIITATFSDLTNMITITPQAVGETTFKVSDGVKEFAVHVKVENGSTATETQFYIRGTAANGWGAVSEAYVLRESSDPNNIGEILDVELKVGEFKIAKADWSEEIGWDYDSRSTIIGGAAAKFAAGESENNIKCNVAGYYNIYLTTNHYISIESVGGDPVPTPMSSYYVRGTAVGSWDPLPASQMALDVGNKAIIEGLEMVVGEFKIANADWSEKWGYTYKNDDEESDHITIIGGAAGNFGPGASDGNIACNVAGTYNLYLTNNNYISIELASPTPPPTPDFALSATSGEIEAGGSIEVNALNLTGTFHYNVTSGTADVVIDGAKATISSSTVGTATISFSDDSEADPIIYTLTVATPVAKHSQYIETKEWFNNNLEGEKVYVYAYKDGSDPFKENTAFPGEEATWVKDLEDGKKLFSYQLAETFDTFVVVRVVSGTPGYQTVDISVADLSGDNCIYLDAESGSNEIPIGHYDYALKLSSNSGTITAGHSKQVTIQYTLADIEYEVSPADSATVVINEGVATISSSTVGTSTITFSDGVNVATYTLTVNAAAATTKQYIETKSWFNSNQEGEKVYVYAYKDGSSPIEENAAFPGEEATWVKDLEDGKKLFSYDIEDTFDTFVVVRVVSGTPGYQTENVSIVDLSGDNCIYLDAEGGSASIPVGHYDYSLRLSASSGTITSGNNTSITFVRNLAIVTATVSPEGSATVEIVGNTATISSSTEGTSTITFSDGTNDATYTLTVNPAVATRRVYIETKSWFNSNQEGEKVYVYAFKEAGEDDIPMTSWPGYEAHWVKDIEDGKKIFYFDIPETYDTFIVVRVVSGTAGYQTVDISIATLGTDNCVYLNADSGSTSIPVGHYTYVPA